MFYELLTGEKPFSGPPHAVLAKLADSQLEPPTPRSRDATISKDLEAICQRAMGQDATNRDADMQALADDLERSLEGKPTELPAHNIDETTSRQTVNSPAVFSTTERTNLPPFRREYVYTEKNVQSCLVCCEWIVSRLS